MHTVTIGNTFMGYKIEGRVPIKSNGSDFEGLEFRDLIVSFVHEVEVF